MKYRILFKEIGFTMHHGVKVLNKDKYDKFENIPTFDEEKHPITEGLKLLEKNDKLEVVDISKMINDTDADTDVKDAVNDTDTDTDDAADDDADNTSADEVSTVEYNGEEIPLTNESLNELKVSELDEICEQEGLEGYSALNKAPKIEFIIEQLA